VSGAATPPQDCLDLAWLRRKKQIERVGAKVLLRFELAIDADPPEDPAGLIARLADPAVRIVSTTVTEKGYSYDPATGALREDDVDIRHDLLHGDRPYIMLSTIVGGLKRRRAANIPNPASAKFCLELVTDNCQLPLIQKLRQQRILPRCCLHNGGTSAVHVPLAHITSALSAPRPRT
jgi:mannitol-1-phosphate/altronate dehydrogenase